MNAAITNDVSVNYAKVLKTICKILEVNLEFHVYCINYGISEV